MLAHSDSRECHRNYPHSVVIHDLEGRGSDPEAVDGLEYDRDAHFQGGSAAVEQSILREQWLRAFQRAFGREHEKVHQRTVKNRILVNENAIFELLSLSISKITNFLTFVANNSS